MKGKTLFSKLQKHKEKILRQIEYRRLKRVRRKKTPQYTYCKNCGTKLDGMYCYQCGQYALDIEQPFWKYILQYFENVYQFDSKVWLTLYYLFTRPGFLTREFNAGKINSYVHPLRLFMFLSCLFFLFFFALIPSSLDSINWSVEGEVGEPSEVSAGDVITQMELSEDVIDFWYDDLSAEERAAAVDTTIYFCGDSVMQKTMRRVSKQLPSELGDTLRFSVPKILLEKGYLLPITAQDSIYALAEDETYFGSEPDEVKKELNKIETEMNFGAFVSWYSTYLPIILLLLIPVFALLLKLFFRKEKMTYMKHYAFALHLHSVLLLLVAVNLLWAYYVKTPYTKEVSLGLMNLFLLYMWIAIHQVYEQTGWVKAFIKTGLLYVLYMLILGSVFIGTLVWCAVHLFHVDFTEYM